MLMALLYYITNMHDYSSQVRMITEFDCKNCRECYGKEDLLNETRRCMYETERKTFLSC